jgi:hypothetical protein
VNIILMGKVPSLSAVSFSALFVWNQLRALSEREMPAIFFVFMKHSMPPLIADVILSKQGSVNTLVPLITR